MGGEAELTTATDFRVMSSGAKIQFVQARMGISTAWGGGNRLVKLVGRRKALELLETARSLTAISAVEYGLADSVCYGEDPVYCALEFLQTYLTEAHPTRALRAIKTTVAAADELPTNAAAEVEQEAFRSTWALAQRTSVLSLLPLRGCA